jgi:hypothetical protein
MLEAPTLGQSCDSRRSLLVSWIALVPPASVPYCAAVILFRNKKIKAEIFNNMRFGTAEILYISYDGLRR